MRILMVNKFLYPNGGSETYILKLGAYLQTRGHAVEYFGMDDERRCVGNRVNAYTSHMDFHKGSLASKITYPLKTIYSSEARRKLRRVLEDFCPDVVHLNNFNYQLTPSVILEVCSWRKKTGNRCKIIYTAHDYQLVCPNHMLNNPKTHKNCERCLKGRYYFCVQGRCIHGSVLRSAIGAAEAFLWNKAKVYRHIDTIICCSEFMKKKLDGNPLLYDKTVTMHNFIDKKEENRSEKGNYVLYFGRYSYEKGVLTLLRVCQSLPEIPFVFAGAGPLEKELENVPNIHNAGFQTGENLDKLIREAKFCIYPSQWYENCPFSVMESQCHQTPVLGADIGGIPELIRDGCTGELFESGNKKELRRKIKNLWGDQEKILKYSQNCKNVDFDTTEEYYEKLIKIYQQE